VSNLLRLGLVAAVNDDDRTLARQPSGDTFKHKSKPAIHGFKAHVGADADTALVEVVAITPANIHDGKAGSDALPDEPGDVFADSACRGTHFRDAVLAKGGTPRIVATHMCGRDERETLMRLKAWNQPIHRLRGRIEKIFGTENLRRLEALLRVTSDSMVGLGQSIAADPPDRHRLQHETNPGHPYCRDLSRRNEEQQRRSPTDTLSSPLSEPWPETTRILSSKSLAEPNEGSALRRRFDSWESAEATERTAVLEHFAEKREPVFCLRNALIV